MQSLVSAAAIFCLAILVIKIHELVQYSSLGFFGSFMFISSDYFVQAVKETFSLLNKCNENNLAENSLSVCFIEQFFLNTF